MGIGNKLTKKLSDHIEEKIARLIIPTHSKLVRLSMTDPITIINILEKRDKLVGFSLTAGNTKWGSIIVLLTSCLTGLESAV